MGINLNGSWKYKEDFSQGDSEGTLELNQKDSILSGVLIHIETPISEPSFEIEQKLVGSLNEELSTISLRATEVRIIHSNIPISYELDSFGARVMSNDLIVGTTEDKQGVIGVFSFKRI